MSTHKKIDIICCVAVIFALLITVGFLNAEAFGIRAADKAMGYEGRLFDEEKVHTIDIVIDDWDAFLATCQNEEYSVCNVLIDGEAFTNIGIRGKGNTSLSTVSSMDSDRYSFKIEFDQYDSTKSYYGLDKLCLNNIIQDNTYMKDYLAYQLMDEFGVDAPLCSYAYITVNGEDWGLYLAVEGIEDSFLQRNYGNDYGELYKPDSMSFGGGRGNGKDFNMEDFDFSQIENFSSENRDSSNQNNSGNNDDISSGNGSIQKPFGDMFSGQMPNMGEMPQGGNFPVGDMQVSEGMEIQEDMGSSDVKLQYIDDNAASYSNIFDNAKTDISEADEQRLIASLKALSEGEDIESVINVEEVIRYFVVHNFLVNGDSYTGSMIHNYYLYEEDGRLSMIPWDYNLAYGTFQGSNVSDAVNDPIDSPVSGNMSDRPMVSWIFGSEEYTEIYHQYFAEFVEKYYTNGELPKLINDIAELIAPYVEKDPTKFCTYEEFEIGVEAMRQFCQLRLESVAGQLAGIIPSTSEGQSADSSNLVDASGLNISDLGTMNQGVDGGFGGNRGDRTESGFGGDRGENSRGGSIKNGSDAVVAPGNNGEAFSEGMEMPNMDNMQFPNSESVGKGSGVSAETIVLFAASLVCLLAGLLVAFKYKR